MSAMLSINIPLDQLSKGAQAEVTSLLAKILGSSAPAVLSVNAEHFSYPLNEPLTNKLIEGIHANTAAVLKACAENYDPITGRGSIAWLDAKRLTSVRDWTHFAQGNRAGLHKRLRRITGDPDAQLLVEDSQQWEWDDETRDWSKGWLFVDGQAIHALRSHFGLE